MAKKPRATKTDLPLPTLSLLDGPGRERARLRVARVSHPAPDAMLGDFSDPIEVSGPSESARCLLRAAVDPGRVVGIDLPTARLFRWESKEKRLVPIWDSGVNQEFGVVWGKIANPGIYVAIGLPRDRLVLEVLRALARARRLADTNDPKSAERLTRSLFRTLLEEDAQSILDARSFLARLELQTGVERLQPQQAEMAEGGHVKGFALPGGQSLEQLKKRIAQLRTLPGGLPEEQLFYPPDGETCGTPPWPLSNQWQNWDGVPISKISKSGLLAKPAWWWLWPWLFSKNWWMYQHDRRHSGRASGPSDITRTSVNRLYRRPALSVDGPVVMKPAIVDGKIYIGSGRQGGGGGTLYKFDLHSGTKEGEFPTSGLAYYSWVNGIGGSPAVTGGRAYFTGVHGKVYCVDTSTMTPTAPHPPALWETDLTVADSSKNQPVNQPDADCWSGPVVADGRVYVGCGEGEAGTWGGQFTYGFVYCLDAETGHVLWLFCTDRFSGAAHNMPNAIPSTIAAPWAAAAGFTLVASAPESGCAVWSSCAYDSVLRRIYVGTGNSKYPTTAQPDDPYGSGLISLDAVTGAFMGFFQPTQDDSYWPGDSDIDVPGSASVVNRGVDRVVAFGSKNGSFFLLDPNNLACLARRQLLPRLNGTGLPGNRGTPIAAVVPTGGTGENSYGIFGTPAYHYETGKIFVAIGGYNGMALDAGAGIDKTRTPFLRAVDWNTLVDAWPTITGADGVIRYSLTKPPMYSSLEVGLSSPAVVNDVVFVSTDKVGLYALDVNDGHCLWSDPNPLPSGEFALGPAIYGNYVVMGAGDKVYVYTLRFRFPWPFPYPIPYWPWPYPDPTPRSWPFPFPPSPPPPDPWEWIETGQPDRAATRVRRVRRSRKRRTRKVR